MSTSSDVGEYLRRIAEIKDARWFRWYLSILVSMVIAGVILNQLGTPSVPGGQHPDILAAMGGLFGSMVIFYLLLLVPILAYSAFIRIRTVQTNYEW